MRNLVRASSVAATLMAALAIRSPSEKPAANTCAKPSVHYETATLAGGCFWSLQASLSRIPGVVKTTVGYMGGTTPDPTYDRVCTCNTGYAEAVQVVFDPMRLSYKELLNRFFRAHDPTSPRHQTKGVKVRYRSAIFYYGDEQRRMAERVKNEMSQSGKWNHPIITEITPATKFYPAAAYFQEHIQNFSDARACGVRD